MAKHISGTKVVWTGSTRHFECTTNWIYSVEFFHVAIGPRLDDQLLFHSEEHFLLAPMQNHVDYLVAHGRKRSHVIPRVLKKAHQVTPPVCLEIDKPPAGERDSVRKNSSAPPW